MQCDMTLNSRPIFQTRTAVADVFDCESDMCYDLATKKTISGFTLNDHIQTCLDLNTDTVGISGIESDSYCTFKSVFDAVLNRLGCRNLPGNERSTLLERNKQGIKWFSSTQIVSSSISVHRNFNGFPFLGFCSRAEKRRIFQIASLALASLNEPHFSGQILRLSEMAAFDFWTFQAEGISLVKPTGALDWPDSRGLFVSDGHALQVRINFNDHLNITYCLQGVQFNELFRNIDLAVSRIEATLDQFLGPNAIMFDQNYGYLTSDPLKLGVGLVGAVVVKLKHFHARKFASKFQEVLNRFDLDAQDCSHVYSSTLDNVEFVCFLRLSTTISTGKTAEEIVGDLLEGVQLLLLIDDAIDGPNSAIDSPDEGLVHQLIESIANQRTRPPPLLRERSQSSVAATAALLEPVIDSIESSAEKKKQAVSFSPPHTELVDLPLDAQKKGAWQSDGKVVGETGGVEEGEKATRTGERKIKKLDHILPTVLRRCIGASGQSKVNNLQERRGGVVREGREEAVEGSTARCGYDHGPRSGPGSQFAMMVSLLKRSFCCACVPSELSSPSSSSLSEDGGSRPLPQNARLASVASAAPPLPGDEIARESEFATGTIIPEANTTTKGYLFEALDSPKRAFEEVKAGDYVEAQRRHGDTSGGAADVGAETGAPRPIAGHSETLLMRALPELDSITDYPVFTFAHRSCMAKLMSPAIYHVMESRRTSSGFSLARAIRCGVEDTHGRIGIVAGDEESYALFPEIFLPVIADLHAYDGRAATALAPTIAATTLQSRGQASALLHSTSSVHRGDERHKSTHMHNEPSEADKPIKVRRRATSHIAENGLWETFDKDDLAVNKLAGLEAIDRECVEACACSIVRNLVGFPLMPCISRLQRRQVQYLLQAACAHIFRVRSSRDLLHFSVPIPLQSHVDEVVDVDENGCDGDYDGDAEANKADGLLCDNLSVPTRGMDTITAPAPPSAAAAAGGGGGGGGAAAPVAVAAAAKSVITPVGVDVCESEAIQLHESSVDVAVDGSDNGADVDGDANEDSGTSCFHWVGESSELSLSPAAMTIPPTTTALHTVAQVEEVGIDTLVSTSPAGAATVAAQEQERSMNKNAKSSILQKESKQAKKSEFPKSTGAQISSESFTFPVPQDSLESMKPPNQVEIVSKGLNRVNQCRNEPPFAQSPPYISGSVLHRGVDQPIASSAHTISSYQQFLLLQDVTLTKPALDSTAALSGCARDWPDGRAMFYSPDRALLVVINDEDHMKIISTVPEHDIVLAFRRLSQAITEMEDYLWENKERLEAIFEEPWVLPPRVHSAAVPSSMSTALGLLSDTAPVIVPQQLHKDHSDSLDGQPGMNGKRTDTFSSLVTGSGGNAAATAKKTDVGINQNPTTQYQQDQQKPRTLPDLSGEFELPKQSPVASFPHFFDPTEQSTDQVAPHVSIFQRSTLVGTVSTSPMNVGSGVYATMIVRLGSLGDKAETLEAVCNNVGLTAELCSDDLSAFYSMGMSASVSCTSGNLSCGAVSLLFPNDTAGAAAGAAGAAASASMMTAGPPQHHSHAETLDAATTTSLSRTTPFDSYRESPSTSLDSTDIDARAQGREQGQYYDRFSPASTMQSMPLSTWNGCPVRSPFLFHSQKGSWTAPSERGRAVGGGGGGGGGGINRKLHDYYPAKSIWKIRNKSSLGRTEVQVVQLVIDGVAALLAMDKKVEEGAARAEEFAPMPKTMPLPQPQTCPLPLPSSLPPPP